VLLAGKDTAACPLVSSVFAVYVSLLCSSDQAENRLTEYKPYID